METVSFTIPHSFLVGEISPNCILRSSFLVKIATEVDYNINKLCLYQGDGNGIALVQEEPCNQEKKKQEIKKAKILL